ncbi:hypothetical protein QBC39DRAFT_8533 [Podospora conica]|nr:hypothetical protein QBC39DRAFT_8533 [Schizothecium conicum]
MMDGLRWVVEDGISNSKDDAGGAGGGGYLASAAGSGSPGRLLCGIRKMLGRREVGEGRGQVRSRHDDAMTMCTINILGILFIVYWLAWVQWCLRWDVGVA